jgi:hypothetical protein
MRFDFQLACLVLLAACGGRVDAGDGGVVDAGTDATDAADAPTTFVCSDLGNFGADVSMDRVPSDPPPLAPPASPPVNGVYVLVGYSQYTGPNGAGGSAGTIAETVRLVSQNGSYVIDYAETVNAVATSTHATAMQAGLGVLDVATVCPTTTSFSVEYTTDGTSLTFRYVDPSTGGTIDTRFALTTK